MRRLICIHGHFYQPPRENPWLETVEQQDSAAPFHDWNARIAAECYGPNGAARLKGADGRIVDIVNNYNHISFNMGPTLLAWLEREAPEIYRQIIKADSISHLRRGHGNALAQAYSHAILPLCSERDRRTQVLWGIADFRHRFGRSPEGFWLPESAVNRDTLQLLAGEGIRFTVLSPYQALRVRAPGGDWQSALNAQFDPTRPYRVELGGGRSIVVFFYDGPIARNIAFTDAATRGDELVRVLESGLDANRTHPELLTVAVDGETFGHHKKGGDEGLAAALRALAARDDVELVNFGQALERVPVEWEAEVAENTSWSCAHGVERWRSDCGCQGNGMPGWRQEWRGPLREALDALNARLAELYEREAAHLLVDPWEARNRFVDVVVDPERRQAPAFLQREARHALGPAEQARALKLLELQRQSLLMYSSCGWFFSELSGLETVQILKYAARAVQLARELGGPDLEADFKQRLARAPSNLPHYGNGARVWEACVKPSIVSLEHVAAHHVITSLFEGYPNQKRVYAYRVSIPEGRKESTGLATLGVGQVELESVATGELYRGSFCVLHFGGSDFRCGLRLYAEPAAHAELERTLFLQLNHLSMARLLREIDRLFPERDYTLRDLFLHERRQLAERLLSDTMHRYESDYQAIYEGNQRLMGFLREIDSPIPGALRVAAEVSLTNRLLTLIAECERGELPVPVFQVEAFSAIRAAERAGARLNVQSIGAAFGKLLRSQLDRVLESANRDEPVHALAALLEFSEHMGLTVDLWRMQNALWTIAGTPEGARIAASALGAIADRLWLDRGILLERARKAATPPELPSTVAVLAPRTSAPTHA